MSLHTAFFDYSYAGLIFEGYLTRPKHEKRPLVLVFHAWGGQHEFERGVADQLAQKGFAALAVDLYGKGNRGRSPEENTALMSPLVSDRADLQARMAATLEMARGLEGVDATKMAAIGFCFGGLCVLDMARMGADINGVVSFHGLLRPADNIPAARPKASILALHGWDDPLATPEDVIAFSQEMTAAGADWQLHGYGDTVHAFTNPAANDRVSGNCYNARATRRAWAACDDFLKEVLE